MSYKQRLLEVVDAMTDAEADALLRWIEDRRKVARESSLPDDGAPTSADVIRDNRDC
jgi:hypothetical protein